MEHIRQAVERAKASGFTPAEPQNRLNSSMPTQQSGFSGKKETLFSIKEIELDKDHLEKGRLIAYNTADSRSNSFDMLRTQIVQAMDQRNWQFLAVTSPTPGCGKTVTAINLALSIARQPERSVLLVDMDLQRPQVASALGLTCRDGLLSLLDGRAGLAEVLVQASIDNSDLLVLPAEAPMLGSSELMASRAMSTLLQSIKRDFKSRTVILDMPPILTSDDVISILPQIDCVLLVAAAGTSTVSEIKDCSKHLQAAEVVRLVLNKSSESAIGYGY